MRALITLFILFFFHHSFSQNSSFQSDATHSGFVGKNAHGAFGDVSWTLKTGGKIFSSPVVFRNVLYVGSEDGHVYAVESSSGKELWKFKTAGTVHSTPSITNDFVFFGSFDGKYYCLDRKTGQERWKFETGGERWPGGRGYFGFKPDTMYMDDPWDFFLSSPVVQTSKNELTVFFGSSDGHLYALNGRTGALKWKFKTDGIIHSTPALSDGVLYFGSWDTFFYAIEAATGKLVWKFKTGDQMGMSGIQTSATIANGNVYFGARDPFLFALDAKTGALKWKYDAENSWILSTAAFKDNTLYMGTSDTYLVLAIDATTGKEKWRRKLFGYVYGSPCLTDKALFIGDFTGRFFSIDPATGTVNSTFETESFQKYKSILRPDGSMNFQDLVGSRDMMSYSVTQDVMNSLYKLGAVVSSATISGNMIYFGSSNGMLYAVNLRARGQ